MDSTLDELPYKLHSQNRQVGDKGGDEERGGTSFLVPKPPQFPIPTKTEGAHQSGLCHPPTSAAIASASAGPQDPGS
jgi:hypothetical protein